jgi:hypothetical protein
MADQVISNPNNAFGQPTPQIQGANAMQASIQVIELANAVPTSTSLQATYGAVMVVDVTGEICNTTTTANDVTVIGVVNQTPATAYNVNTSGLGQNVIPVVVGGVARIQISSNTVPAGALLVSSTTAGVAQANTIASAAASTLIGTVIGVALEAQSAKDSASTIRAIIKKM